MTDAIKIQPQKKQKNTLKILSIVFMSLAIGFIFIFSFLQYVNTQMMYQRTDTIVLPGIEKAIILLIPYILLLIHLCAFWDSKKSNMFFSTAYIGIAINAFWGTEYSFYNTLLPLVIHVILSIFLAIDGFNKFKLIKSSLIMFIICSSLQLFFMCKPVVSTTNTTIILLIIFSNYLYIGYIFAWISILLFLIFVLKNQGVPQVTTDITEKEPEKSKNIYKILSITFIVAALVFSIYTLFIRLDDFEFLPDKIINAIGSIFILAHFILFYNKKITVLLAIGFIVKWISILVAFAENLGLVYMVILYPILIIFTFMIKKFAKTTLVMFLIVSVFQLFTNIYMSLIIAEMFVAAAVILYMTYRMKKPSLQS